MDAFQRGTVAMDKRDYPQSAQFFRDVLKQAPQFTPAIRRLGFSLVGLGQPDDALKLLENAVQIERSPENLISLAEILAYPGENKQGTLEQKERALPLAKEATARNQSSDDSSYAVLTAQIALDVKNYDDFRQATELLVRKFPNQMATHYCNAIRLAMDESWIGAEDEIKKAGRMGLPAQTVQLFLDSGVHTRATAWRWGYYVAFLLAAWACGLVILFLAGKVFSKLTLRFIEGADLNATVSPAETILRQYYRRLIAVAGTYYYISIPFVMFLVLAVTAAIVYGFLYIGQHSHQARGHSCVGRDHHGLQDDPLALRSSEQSEEPGRSLSREEAPGLWNLTREVAEKLETRPLDAIRVVPGTEMAVYERGSYRDRRKGMGQRTLMMGLGLLPGFDQNPFRAVLAHEYGHLSHRDTAGGDVALRVNQDMMKFAYAMARAGQAVWWNIGFQFLRLYHFLFRRISHGATRLQEVLADRAAARLYGARPFEEGLRHVVRRQIEFKYFAGKEIDAALKSGRALQNVYALETSTDKTLEEAVNSAINRQTTEDDTHPSPVDRFRLVSRVAGQNFPGPSGPMWDLFADREAISKEMSQKIESLVKGYG